MSQNESPSSPTASPKPAKKPKAKRQPSHRSTLSLQKTEIRINIYDLLPVSSNATSPSSSTIKLTSPFQPGKLSSLLWFIGGSLLHSGVVIGQREYAYGGHDRPRVSGVYWTRPRLEPPGGTFKLSILHGFCFLAPTEIDAIVSEASERFMGTSYNLLTNNCNHFTSYLCEKLVGKMAPPWLNRAASIGVALPCVVPREWIAPPDCETVDGEMVDEEEDDESAAMLATDRRRRERDRALSASEQDRWEDETERISGNGVVRDTSGRQMPAADRAPVSG
jgi:hypothetical protein